PFLRSDEVVDRGNRERRALVVSLHASPFPNLVEAHGVPVPRRLSASHENVDMVIVLQHVSTSLPRGIGLVVRKETQGAERPVQAFDVVDMDPEIIVCGEDWNAKGDHGPPTDQEYPRTARCERAKERRLVEPCAFHAIESSTVP